MRLSTKFILLVAGTAVVPVLVAVVVLLLGLSDPSGRFVPRDLYSLRRALSELHRLGRETPGPEAILSRLQTASPRVQAIISDPQGAIVLSSVQAGAWYVHYVETVAAADGNTYSVAVGFPMDAGLLRRHEFMLAVPLSLLGFLTLMSILIIRSINRSISRLEEATRRISEGNLDFELRVQGNDRIASLTRSFDRMRERVKEEAAARSRFILGVSHDLKTPLSSITGYLDAIRDGLATSPQILEKYLAIILDKTGLLESRISQLIDFVKLETSEWKRSREPVRLQAFLEEAATVFATEAEARGLHLVCRLQLPEILEVSMDADLVFRALENVMDNAFRHAPLGSEVGFEASRRDRTIVLRLRNRGEPIASEDLPFLFEPFYRGSNARRETGFGLGLSVVKSVVFSHGWQIEVSSAAQETCFTIRIPLAGPEPAGSEVPGAKHQDFPRESRRLG